MLRDIRATFNLVLVLCLTVVSIFLISPMVLAQDEIGTEVGGILPENTTWAIENSPYNIIETIQIPENIVLTIKPGVTVTSSLNRSDDYMFVLHGKIIAQGTAINKIVFDGGSEATTLMTGLSYGASFFSTAGALSDPSLILDNCIIKDGSRLYWGTRGHLNLTNSELSNLGLMYWGYGRSQIYYPEKDVYIQNNVFINTTGFEIGNSNANIFIRYNLFKENREHLVWNTENNGLSLTSINYNSFIDVSGTVLRLSTLGENVLLNATNNYWGTTNTTSIDALIFDGNDEISIHGFIEYEPILSESPLEAQSLPTRVNVTTEVTGMISSDTIWTMANSPYELTGPINVNNGTTLTIEAGTTINLNRYYIQVDGTLLAKGSNKDQIHFNSGSIRFIENSTDWNEQTGTGSIIANAVISLTQLRIEDASPKIQNNTITANPNYYYVIEVWGGSPKINNNIVNGPIGLLYAGSGYSNASINGNIITGYGEGIEISSMGSPTIERNLITENTGPGIYLLQPPGDSNPLIRNNTIVKNSVGLKVLCTYSSSISPIIEFNNIHGNNEFNVHLDSGYSANVNVTNNWWGTTNISEINQTIYDFKRDFNLGIVTFIPFLTAPNLDAPISVNIPAFTPSTNISDSTIATPDPTSSQIPVPGQSFFFVESNSTVSALFFNSTSSELSFIVTGESGTTGYVEVTIAKSLVSNIQNVKVYLDGRQLDVAIGSDEDSWLLSFNYMHSTHNVRISLTVKASITAFPETDYWMWIGVVVIIVVMGTSLLIYVKRRKR